MRSSVMQGPRRALVLLATLGLTVLPTTARADAGWDQVGGYLRQACSYASGAGSTTSWFQFGGDSNLQWVCTISQMYGFVNSSILNGDWEGFAKDIVGRYATDLAHHLTGKLGFGSINATIDQLNDAMRGSYRDFRTAMLGGMRNALAAQGTMPDDNVGLPASTPGGLADYYANTNPVFSAAQSAGRAAQTVEAFKNADLAFKTKKAQEQSNKAIDDIVKPAIANATGVIGIPKVTGKADQIMQQAETALSTREVAVTQVKAMTEMMKQDAVNNTSQLNLLAEIARQSVLSNQQLMIAKEQAENAQATAENQLKTYLEGQAEDALNQARETTNQIHDNVLTSVNLLSPDAMPASDLGEYAP